MVKGFQFSFLENIEDANNLRFALLFTNDEAQWAMKKIILALKGTVCLNSIIMSKMVFINKVSFMII